MPPFTCFIEKLDELPSCVAMSIYPLLRENCIFKMSSLSKLKIPFVHQNVAFGAESD